MNKMQTFSFFSETKIQAPECSASSEDILLLPVSLALVHALFFLDQESFP